jgi:hypothetical protein
MGKAAAAAGVAAGIAAGGAAAVAPPPGGTFFGETSQTAVANHSVEVDTNASSRVQRVYVQWQAKCKAKGKFWTSTTKVSNGSKGLFQNGDVFQRKHSYTGNAGGGITGRITYSLKGHFTDNDHADGTWTAQVVVRRKGKKIDSCKTPKITWSVTRG